MKKWFDEPTQVKFLENEDIRGDRDTSLGGIAFHDFVICGECGATVELDDIESIEELPWISISEEILGEVDK